MRKYTIFLAAVAALLILSSCSYVTSMLQGPAGPDGTDGLSVVWLGSLATAPANPKVNDAYYNTTDGISYFWDGSAWQVLARDGQDGLDGVNGANGADGSDGLSIVWLGSFPTAPLTPNINEAYYNTTDGRSYIWDGTAWQILAQDGFLDVSVTLTIALGSAIGFVDDAFLGREFTVMLDADVDPVNANEIVIYNGQLPPGQDLISDFPDDNITVTFTVPSGTAASGWYAVYVWIEDDNDNPNGNNISPGLVNNGSLDPVQDLIYAVGNNSLIGPNIFFPAGGAVSWTLLIEGSTLSYLWPPA